MLPLTSVLRNRGDSSRTLAWLELWDSQEFIQAIQLWQPVQTHRASTAFPLIKNQRHRVGTHGIAVERNQTTFWTRVKTHEVVSKSPSPHWWSQPKGSTGSYGNMYLPLLLKDTIFIGTTILLKTQAGALQPLPCLLAANAIHLLQGSWVCPFRSIPPVTVLIKSRLDSCNSLPTEVLCMCSLLSHVQHFVTPWTAGPRATHQAPLPMEFSRHEYWSGLPFSSAGESSLAQRSKPGCPHCRQILYQLSHQGNATEVLIYSFHFQNVLHCTAK